MHMELIYKFKLHDLTKHFLEAKGIPFLFYMAMSHGQYKTFYVFM